MKFRRHKPELTVRRNGQYSVPLQTAENQVINSILFIISSNYNMSRLDTDNSTVSDTTNPTKATERQEGATRGEEKQEGPTGEHRDDTEEAKEQPERKIENQRLNEPNNGKDRRRHEKPPKQHGRQRTQEQERTTDEEEQGPQEHAHTSVPDGREKILRDPEKLPSTPQEGDFNRDVVLQDLRRGFKKNNYDYDIPSPETARTNLGVCTLQALKKTEIRPKESVEFKYVRASKREYEMINDWRPILNEHYGFRGFAQLVIHRKRDKEHGDKGYIPIPADSVRPAFGLKPQKSGKQLGALPFLWAYKAFVDEEFEWSSYKDGRCRRIINHGTPDEIMDEAQRFYHDRRGHTVINFMKGDVSTPTENAYRTQCFDSLDENRRTADDATIAPPRESQRIIKYLNRLGRQATSGKSIFDTLAEKGNVQQAVDTLLDAADKNAEMYNEGIRQSIRQLRRFEDLPYLLYQAGDTTPRPTPKGGNHLVGVDSRAIPPLLGDRHVALDLSKAQLAMFLRFMDDVNHDMPETQGALEKHMAPSNDYDLWQSLGEKLDIGFRRASEPNEAKIYAVKRAIYSAVYGATKDTIRWVASCEICQRTHRGFPNGEQIDGLFEHEVLSEVLEARRKAFRHIKDDGGVEDAFGRRLPLEEFTSEDSNSIKEQPEIRTDEDNEQFPPSLRSLFACAIQSYEVKTMWPIFEAAIEERKGDGKDRWRVLLYKYDEVILWSRHEHQVQKWAEKAIGLVQKQTERLGIKTKLDVEYPEGLFGKSGT